MEIFRMGLMERHLVVVVLVVTCFARRVVGGREEKKKRGGEVVSICCALGRRFVTECETEEVEEPKERER